MLTLKDWMELVDYKITEGSDYWPEGNLGGRQLYSLDSWNGDQNGWSFSIGFDPKDQKVCVVEVCDYKNGRAYRRADPVLKLDKRAWDEVDWIDLEEDDDFIQKAQAIKAGDDYDTRVDVPLTLPDDVLFELMKQAHEQDITLNELVEDILWSAISAEKSRRLEDDGWDDIAEDHWDDDGDEMSSDLLDLKPAAAMKAKKKKKSK